MTWVQSSRCDGSNCLQTAYRTSSHCDGGQCLEAAHRGGHVLVRNNQQPADVLAFPPADWQALLDNLKEADHA